MSNQVFLWTAISTWLGLCLSSLAAVAQEVDQDSSISAASGIVEIADAQVSLIQNTFLAAQIAGVVADVSVTEGDEVEVGRRLVQLDSEVARTELQVAQAAYEAARLESDNDVNGRYARRILEVHEQELQQGIDANRKFAGSISQTEISKLQLLVDQSRLGIEQAEHQLQVARANSMEKLATSQIVEARLRKHDVDATVSGIVVEVAVQPGEWVDAGKPIVRVISLDPIRVECFVDGRKHGPELVGRLIEFFPERAETAPGDREGTKSLPGRVTFVSPELHPVTGQARLWATIENPELSARAGTRGRLVIHAN